MSSPDALKRQFERETGIKARHDWIVSTISAQTASASPTRLLFAHFLESDMNVIGAGCLPAAVKATTSPPSTPKFSELASLGRRPGRHA